MAIVKSLKDAMSKLADSDVGNYFRGRRVVDNEANPSSEYSKRKRIQEGGMRQAQFMQYLKKGGKIRQ